MLSQSRSDTTCISAHLSLFAIAAVLFFLSLSGCVKNSPPPLQPGQPRPYKVNGKWYQPFSESDNFTQEGIASWYGADFHGKKTSNGEIYDMHAMTAAHKTLPLGTYVLVHNLENNKMIEVRINDRGPFVRGRIIDLSFKAATELGVIKNGTARVKIAALGTDPKPTVDAKAPGQYHAGNYSSGKFSFQVGAFSSRENAEKMKKDLEKTHKNVHIAVHDDGAKILYRVRVGSYSSLDEIVNDEKILINKGFKDMFIVAE